jgi:hypothetical protein
MAAMARRFGNSCSWRWRQTEWSTEGFWLGWALGLLSFTPFYDVSHLILPRQLCGGRAAKVDFHSRSSFSLIIIFLVLQLCWLFQGRW